MKVSQLVQSPPTTVRSDASVFEAVKSMEKANVGAAAVVDGERLVGVISERDVMVRVVGAKKDPAKTKVRTVMTKSVRTLRADCGPEEAISVMVENHIRHVVLVNRSRRVLGVASARDVFQARVDSLDDQVRTLEAFVEQDGHGG